MRLNVIASKVQNENKPRNFLKINQDQLGVHLSHQLTFHQLSGPHLTINLHWIGREPISQKHQTYLVKLEDHLSKASTYVLGRWEHCKPKPYKAYRELPVSQFTQGKTCFHYREPLFSLQGFPCKPLYFPVRDCSEVDAFERWVPYLHM
jgi:hypothetical protein